MTRGFYPCPVCQKDPLIERQIDGSFMAACYCTNRRAETLDGLKHVWNDLYCADDPYRI